MMPKILENKAMNATDNTISDRLGLDLTNGTSAFSTKWSALFLPFRTPII